LSIVIAALATLAHASRARAADATATPVDLVRLVDRGSQWLVSAATEAPRITVDAGARGDTPAAGAVQPLVVLAAPRAAVLVRDWRGSVRAFGPTTVTDDLRPSASYRMVLLRASSSGRLSGYAQLGAGQWRLDPVLFPAMRCGERLAGQIGGGLELRTPVGLRLAGEASYTIVYREADDDPAPRFFTLLLAARATF
jgi:hypothetical protein